MQGYSGFFDLVRIDEDVLDRVYEHDVALMGEVDALGQAIEQIPSKENTAELLAELLRRSDELDKHWDLREDMLAGLE